MSPEDFLSKIINPGLQVLSDLGGPSATDAARRMLLSIAMQESGPSLDARYQNSPSATPGPARGWWQFEQGGGVAGVLSHSASATLATKCLSYCSVVNSSAAAWRALEGNDELATMFARLLVLTDPAALPSNQQDGWNYYLRNWRPGKPKPDVWPSNWATASKAVGLSA